MSSITSNGPSNSEFHRCAAIQHSPLKILTPPERSFQEAIVAFSQGDVTIAKIRFRQARDTFEDALGAVINHEGERFNPPIEVSVTPDRELLATELAEIESIPDSAAAALAQHDIETIDALESTTEPPWTPTLVGELLDEEQISDETATTLTLLSWWHGDSCEFESGEAITKRQQQAEYGFNQSR